MRLAERELSPQNVDSRSRELAEARPQMKAIQKILVGAVGALGLALGYSFFFSSSLDQTVREHDKTMTRHEEALDRHDTEIEAARKDAADNTKRIELLESELQKTRTELAQTQKDVDAHEAKVKELDNDSRENSEQLVRLRGELEALRSKFAELERNQERLQRAVAESRQLIRTRLKQIEQRLGISSPDP